MRTFFLSLVLSLAILPMLKANDGVYFTSGSFLVPVHETDIAVAREVLTISIGKDSLATVDVQYEFVNRGEAKTVTMAFEASAPYNDLSPLNRRGVHPYISDFTVLMNGASLPYRNAVVACRLQDGTHTVDFSPLDLTRWKGYGEVADSLLPENDALYNTETDSVTAFAYAYYFDAPFVKGVNTVRHTYRYRMSFSVAQRFEIPYWLTPALRWANGQVDDFTLKITSEMPTDVCLEDSLFRAAPFHSTTGSDLYHLTTEYGQHLLMGCLSEGDTIVWHGRDFRPTGDMTITSPTWERGTVMNRQSTSAKVIVTADGTVYRYIADCDDGFLGEAQDYVTIPKKNAHIKDYSADGGRGWLTVAEDMASRVRVRAQPTTRSRIVRTIGAAAEGMPQAYPCLGLVATTDKDGGYLWFRIRVAGRTGYVRQDLMRWDAVNPF